MRHFPGSDDIGSVFFARTPEELLTYAANAFPETFKTAVPDPEDNRKRLSFVADKEIGLCNVVHISELTTKEAESITNDDRDGFQVKTVHTDRKFSTREFQIILDENNTVITMFPGPMAPPIPKAGGKSEFWDNHAFIKQL